MNEAELVSKTESIDLQLVTLRNIRQKIYVCYEFSQNEWKRYCEDYKHASSAGWGVGPSEEDERRAEVLKAQADGEYDRSMSFAEAIRIIDEEIRRLSKERNLLDMGLAFYAAGRNM
jgi:hypothetical protein